MKIRTPLFLLTLAAFASPSYAQWYAGGTIGRSESSLETGTRNDQLFELGFNGASTRVDDKDSAFRVYGGYRFHRHFAAEVGYVDLGRFELRSNVLPTGTFDSSMRSRGVDLSVLGLLPIGDRFTLFGRVGVLGARTRSSFSSSGSVRINEGSGNDSERSSGALYGVGVMASITPNFDVRVEFTEHRKLGDDLSGEFEVQTLAAGVQYRF